MADTILIATDGSAAAQAAACAAIDVAAARQMGIRGLYVVDEALALDSYATPDQELGIERGELSRSELIGEFERQGNLALEWLRAQAGEAGLPVTTDLLVGGVAELVLREAREANMLALGRTGHTHAGDLGALGSHFPAIAHHAHLPLLVGGAGCRSLRRVLLACHGETQPGEELDWVSALHQALGAEVVVLLVDAEPESDRARQWAAEVEAQLAMSGLQEHRRVVVQGEPGWQIPAVAEAEGVDLIVMRSYRHTAVVAWLLGSPVDEVLRATPLPVLLA